MKPFLAACALLLLGAGGSSTPPICAVSGCFVGQAEGVRAGELRGRAVYRVSPEGDLVILLFAPGAAPVTLVFSRDSGGAPATPGDLVVLGTDEEPAGPTPPLASMRAMLSTITAGLDSLGAHGVDVSAAKRGLAGDPAPEAVASPISVGITGGLAYAPTWAIPAESGTLHLAPGPGGLLVGRFEVSGEGLVLRSGDPVTITVRGTFRAERLP